jgi:hypothetical protein
MLIYMHSNDRLKHLIFWNGGSTSVLLVIGGDYPGLIPNLRLSPKDSLALVYLISLIPVLPRIPQMLVFFNQYITLL